MPITINNFQLFFQRIVTGFRAYCGLQFIQCFFSFRKLYGCHRGIKAHSGMYAVHAVQCFFHMHAAMVAHHAFYFEFFLHDCFCWRFNFFVFFSFMYSFPFQQQAVAHHTDTAECHGRTGYHRVQQEAVDGIEYSGRNGYTYYIIYKCPEEILPDEAPAEIE